MGQWQMTGGAGQRVCHHRRAKDILGGQWIPAAHSARTPIESSDDAHDGGDALYGANSPTVQPEPLLIGTADDVRDHERDDSGAKSRGLSEITLFRWDSESRQLVMCGPGVSWPWSLSSNWCGGRCDWMSSTRTLRRVPDHCAGGAVR
jgi:hypothetical protein